MRLSKDEVRALMQRALDFSQADDCIVNLNSSAGGNIRYARNTVSTSGMTNDVTMAVQSAYGKKVGVATINEFDDASLEKVVRRSEELAKLAPENPEYLSPLGPQEYDEIQTKFDSTENITPAFRAEAAANSINPSKAKDLVCAGFLQDSVDMGAMLNSKGLFAFNESSSINFSVTIRTADGTGSGWATRDYNDASKLDTAEVSGIAIDKSIMSMEARAIEPGKYTVILEPAAASGLLQNLIFSLGARQADEGRSFMSKQGGGTKVGEKMFDERVNIYSDPANSEVPTAAWSGDGRRIDKTMWIENGVVKNLFYSRFWADKQGVDATPFPANGIMVGGDKSTAELIANTERGILVSRTWYIRTVDPQTLLVTGLTRDGTFFIENGKIKYPVKNFRFNESPIIMLNNLEDLGRPQRINGNLIPPMKIRDFTFSSLSDAV